MGKLIKRKNDDEYEEKGKKVTCLNKDNLDIFLRKISIYFLVFIVFITVISKIMYNVLIAEVDVEKINEGEIYMEILGEAVVQSDAEAPLYVTPDLYVNKINVAVGDTVKKGDVLFEIDTDELEKVIDSKTKQVEKMEMSLNDIINEAAVSDKKDEVTNKQLNEEYSSVKAKYEKKKKDALADINEAKEAYKDYCNIATSTDASSEKKYLDDIKIKQETYDDLIDEENEAVATLIKQMELENIGEAELSTIEQMQIDIEEAKNEIDELEKIQLSDGKFVSDYDGKVSKINLIVGESTMSNAAMVIAKDNEKYVVKAEFSTNYKKYISQGDILIINTENDNQKIVIESVFEDEEKDVLTVCSSIEANENLEIGNYYQAQIKTESKQYDYVVPKSAVVAETSGDYCIYTTELQASVLGKNLATSKINVKILDKDNDRVAIDGAGLYYGMDVIVDSQRQLSNGTRVKIRDK